MVLIAMGYFEGMITAIGILYKVLELPKCKEQFSFLLLFMN